MTLLSSYCREEYFETRDLKFAITDFKINMFNKSTILVQLNISHGLLVDDSDVKQHKLPIVMQHILNVAG